MRAGLHGIVAWCAHNHGSWRFEAGAVLMMVEPAALSLHQVVHQVLVRLLVDHHLLLLLLAELGRTARHRARRLLDAMLTPLLVTLAVLKCLAKSDTAHGTTRVAAFANDVEVFGQIALLLLAILEGT